MTRKDYILIAGALRASYVRTNPDNFNNQSSKDTALVEREGVLTAAYQIAVALEGHNRRFNREHFLAVVLGEKDLTSRPSRDGRSS